VSAIMALTGASLLTTFFSSIFLAQNLFYQKLEYIGTLNKNKLEIPIEFKASKSRKVDTSIFGFNNSLTLVSFVP
jgi:hypothetical protein